MAKKTTLREKKVRKYGSSYKYDRVWVNKHFSDATHVPFGKGSILDKYDDYYWGTDKRIDNYVKKFFFKHIGEDVDSVYSKFAKLGFKEAGCIPEKKWEQFVYGNTSLRLWRYRKWGDYFYIDDDGKLAYEPRTHTNRCSGCSSFTQEQLLHNERQIIPQYGKVAREPLGKSGERRPDGTGVTMRGMRKLGEFYVGYKGKTLLLPVYALPCVTKDTDRPDWWYGSTRKTPTLRSHEEFKDRYMRVNLYGTSRKPMYAYHHYIIEAEHDVLDDNGEVTGSETVDEDYGYGLLNTYIMTAQAEKELQKICHQ